MTEPLTRPTAPVVLVHDSLLVQGGAEALSLDLAEALQADLVVEFAVAALSEEARLRSIPVRQLGRELSHTALRQLSGIWTFTRRTGFLSHYDQVIYSGSTAPSAVVNHPQGRNILYCHTPPRFVYDLRDYWLEQASWWQKPLLRWLSGYVRRHYERAFHQMDLVIANSENVQRRIRHYLGADSVVIHPPCDTEGFRWLAQGNYYLSTSRLEPYKRVAMVVEAFSQMPEHRLVVASGGSELARLKAMAADAPNIEFTGWLEQDALRELMGRTIASIYIPVDEDFGMSPVESMAAGKPVIGVAEGGLLETVVPGETGLLLSADPSPEELVAALRELTPERALEMRQACEARARLFSRQVFAEKMQSIVGVD